MTPNPTPTTLRDLEEILELVWNGALDISTSDDFRDSKGDLDDSKYLVAQYNIKKLATQSIQEQLKALLPKYRDITDDPKYHTGFNSAIYQIQKAIDDFCSGKGKE